MTEIVRPTIWVCNEAGHPTHKALETIPGAQIQPLTFGDVNPLRVDRVAFHLARGITKYAKADDYLLLSGYQMINVMACVLWLLWFKRLRILQWNAKRKVYELSEKTLDDLMELLQKELERA